MSKIFRQGRRQHILVLFWVIVISLLASGRASAAVTISSFTATAKTAQILIGWKTATEINNSGFNLLRNTTGSGTYTKIAGLIPAKNPGSIMGAVYSFMDSDITLGQTFYYKLESVDSRGSKQQFGPVSAVVGAAPAAPTSTPLATATRTAPVQTPTSTRVPSTATATLASAISPSPSPRGSLTATPAKKVAVAVGAATATPVLSVKLVPPAIPNPNSASGQTNPASSEVVDPTQDLVADPSEVDSENSSNSPTSTNQLDRSYYLGRLVRAMILLSIGALVLGSVTLGGFALYYHARKEERR